MKTLLLLTAAVSALSFAAQAADAQTRSRTRARPAATEPAPLAPAPYRLIGPGSAQEAEVRSTASEAGAADEGSAAAPGQGATPATPTERATPATPASPATGQSATPAAPATPANPAAPAAEEDGDAGDTEAGPDTPERARAQAALTRVIGELRTGNVDYARMSEAVAARVRTQQPALTPALTQYGAVQSIAPLGAAEADGSQRFRVTFANGAATWTINTDAEGRITNLGVE